MKQLIAIAFVLVLLAIPAMGQTPAPQASDSKCTAKFARALSIRGLHIDLSTDELFRLFPDARNNERLKQALETAKAYPDLGNTTFYPQLSVDVTRERWAGVDNIYLRIFDNRVVSYSISYEGPPKGPQWDSTDQWITKLSETLKLPSPSEWSLINGNKGLNCEGVIINANAGSIGVSTEEWSAQVKARAKAYDEQKRREFKP